MTRSLSTCFLTVKQFGYDIGMAFGLGKCVKVTFINSKLAGTSAVELGIETTIRELDQDKSYKQQGIDKGNEIQHSKMKEKIRKECYRRARTILKTELNSANRIEGINTLSMPVVQYSFNRINWTLPNLRRIDTIERKLLTYYKMHHPKSGKD